jgi:hypothetical protein
MSSNATIKVDPYTRGELDKYKLRIAGLLQKPVTQTQALEILVKLGQNHVDEALEIAKEII